MQNSKIIFIIIVVTISLTNCTNSTRKTSEKYFLDSYTIYKYNDKDQLIYELNYDIVDNHDSLYWIDKIEYNDKGQKIKQIEWRPDRGIVDTKWWQYDSFGSVLSNGGFFEDKESAWQYKYIRNDKNQVITTQHYEKNKYESFTQNFYDSNGNLYLEIEYDSTNQISRKDSSVWINKIILKHFSTENGKMMLKYETLYDDKKNPIARTEYDSKGNIGDKVIWVIDAEGKQKLCKMYDKNGTLKTIAWNIYNKGLLTKTLWIHKKNK